VSPADTESSGNAPRASVLVVEDEAHLAAGLKLNLELEGYRVQAARSLRDARGQLVAGNAIDLILLDIMLPDGDGYSFCRQLRDSGLFVPVIMLTARSAAEERVRGLDSGADDYLAKPFELPELLARVRSALRRSTWAQQGAPQEMPRGSYRFGNARIDFDTHEALAGDKPVRLTQLELDLLHYFSQHPMRVLTREELLEQVWKLHNAPNTRSVDNFIVRLRKYFEPQPDKPVHFLSNRGAGYKFVPDPVPRADYEAGADDDQ
jgi:two-component system OmpR family response regulator